MTLLASLLLMPCLAAPSDSDRITVANLLPEFPGLAAVAPETPLAMAPAPGVARVFRTPELRSIAARWSITPPDTSICVERPVVPLDPEKLRSAMRKSLPEGTIEIIEFSRRLAPEGEIEFPLTGLTNSPASSLWNGYVLYGGGHKFAIWARVTLRMSTPCVVASRDLLPGQPVPPYAVTLETREQAATTTACVRSLEGTAGKWPRLWIRAGTVILNTQLESAKDVARGETVLASVQEGSAHLETEARAEASGAAGDRIPVRNPKSQKRFWARVTGKGRVSVIPLAAEANQ
jgi:flagella basal body P-ring formation protein FlgA